METYLGVNEVAKSVGVTSSTIKKYYLLFEKRNYKFKRNKQGQLIFSEGDVRLFHKLIELKNEPGMIVSDAVEKLLKEKGIGFTNDISVQVRELIMVINDLKQLVIQQNGLIKMQQEQLNRIEEDRKMERRMKIELFEKQLSNYISQVSLDLNMG